MNIKKNNFDMLNIRLYRDNDSYNKQILSNFKRQMMFLLSCYQVHEKILDKRRDQLENDKCIIKIEENFRNIIMKPVNKYIVKKFYKFLDYIVKNQNIPRNEAEMYLTYVFFDNNVHTKNVWHDVYNLLVVLDHNI